MTATTVEQPIDYSALARRLRYPAVLVALGLVVVVVFAWIGKQSNSGLLDPRNTDPNGGHALSVLAAERGVDVSVVTSLAGLTSDPTTTILLAQPDQLSTAAMKAVAATSATVVLIDPGQTALDAFGVAASPDAVTDSTDLVAGCPLPLAVTAGPVEVAGDLYATRGDTTGCYRAGGDAALLQSGRATALTYVLGSAQALTNADLAKSGNAALGLGLLDNDQVDWVPGALDAGPAAGSQRGLLHLLPSRLLWATLQLFVVLVLLALWRARRLGPLVVEPLPVIVRASETAEGQAQLLHAAKARGAAAAALRSATIRRLTGSLHSSAREDPAAVTGATSAASGRPTTEIHQLLYGGEPRDDAELVRLAQELSRLESDVRHEPGGLSQ